ncbi:hypothetical protein PoB_005683500 [Plakobranchus ocellatus]|uniref:Uncharacterized protein n=1 Tax=Plakobranchus ocellatus TaxID=259542 RepID=A0AAV4CFS9_9GAST|nr:hypothetical protein PoB_005683500 [Plakobranchus ocellatus]
MWKLVALLASVLLVTEVCGVCVPVIRCDAKLEEQDMSYLAQDIDESMVMSYLLGARLDEICPIEPKYKSCVESKIYDCGFDDREIYTAKTNLLQYLCSPKGRDLATDLATKTACGHDTWLQGDFQWKLRNCYKIFTADFDHMWSASKADVCQVIETLRQCLIDSAPEACQNDMTTFIEGVWSSATGKKYDFMRCPPL